MVRGDDSARHVAFLDHVDQGSALVDGAANTTWSARCHLSTPSLLTAYASRRFAGRGVSRNLSLQNPARSFLAHDHPITCNHLAPGDRHHRPSDNLEALPWGVVRAMMEILLLNPLATVRVPQGNISVEAYPDRAFSGVETIHLGVIGRGQLDKPVQRNSARRNAFRKQDWQPRFNSRDAIRDPAKRGPGPGRAVALGA